VVNTAARGGVYTALRSAVGGRGTYAFLSLFFPLFFSCFPPRFFASGRGALLPGPELRNPAPAREAAESSRSVRRRRGEESKRWVGPFRIERSWWPPSPPPRPGDVR
jgi:hypothetical protein